MAAPLGHGGALATLGRLHGLPAVGGKYAELDALTALTIEAQAPWHCDFGTGWRCLRLTAV